MFHKNHNLGNLDFTGSEHWSPYNNIAFKEKLSFGGRGGGGGGGGGWDCGKDTIFEGTGSMDFLIDIKIKLSKKLYSPYKIGKSVGFFPS